MLDTDSFRMRWELHTEFSSYTFFRPLANGEELHPRTANDRWKTADPAWLRKHVDPMARLVKTLPKLRYLMPLDAETRHRIAPLSKPYPKRPKQATDGHPPSSGGATPTRTLQDSEVAHVPA